MIHAMIKADLDETECDDKAICINCGTDIVSGVFCTTECWQEHFDKSGDSGLMEAS
jgi:hypothetical protein